MDLKKLYIDGQWVAPLSGQYIDVEIRRRKKLSPPLPLPVNRMSPLPP